ncbi:MAG: PTS sugar transporter subunit IIA [bacterium]|nr:PTS sugar transporter subunit IIA [bacterium]
MTLLDILDGKSVKLNLSASDKDGVLAELIDILVKAGKITERENALSAIMKREELMSTGIGHGVAIPHAKSDAVKELVSAFGCSQDGIDFQSLDGEPAYIFFLLLSPADEATGFHIKALARISRLLKHKYFREVLRKAQTPEEVLSLLKKEEAKHL